MQHGSVLFCMNVCCNSVACQLDEKFIAPGTRSIIRTRIQFQVEQVIERSCKPTNAYGKHTQFKTLRHSKPNSIQSYKTKLHKRTSVRRNRCCVVYISSSNRVNSNVVMVSHAMHLRSQRRFLQHQIAIVCAAAEQPERPEQWEPVIYTTQMKQRSNGEHTPQIDLQKQTISPQIKASEHTQNPASSR